MHGYWDVSERRGVFVRGPYETLGPSHDTVLEGFSVEYTHGEKPEQFEIEGVSYVQDRGNQECDVGLTKCYSAMTNDGRRVVVHEIHCAGCGKSYEHLWGNYEFCPRCGRRIRDAYKAD